MIDRIAGHNSHHGELETNYGIIPVLTDDPGINDISRTMVGFTYYCIASS